MRQRPSFAQQKIRKNFQKCVRCFKRQPMSGGAEPSGQGYYSREWWYTTAGPSGLWYYDYFIQQTMDYYLTSSDAPLWCKQPVPYEHYFAVGSKGVWNRKYYNGPSDVFTDLNLSWADAIDGLYNASISQTPYVAHNDSGWQVFFNDPYYQSKLYYNEAVGCLEALPFNPNDFEFYNLSFNVTYYSSVLNYHPTCVFSVCLGGSDDVIFTVELADGVSTLVKIDPSFFDFTVDNYIYFKTNFASFFAPCPGVSEDGPTIRWDDYFVLEYGDKL